jgi:stage II sporulation protein AA (anti-sigma F factor antagonist)
MAAFSDAPAECLADIAERESARIIVTCSRGRGTAASMLPERLAFTSRRLRSGSVLCVRGEIDIASAPELEREATHLLADAHGRLVLDLSATTFMDLAGLRVTQRLSQRASELDGRLVLVAPTAPVRRILDLVPHPWTPETDDLATALDAIANRFYTSTKAC